MVKQRLAAHTQEQHKSGSRRHPTEKRKVGSSTLPL